MGVVVAQLSREEGLCLLTVFGTRLVELNPLQLLPHLMHQLVKALDGCPYRFAEPLPRHVIHLFLRTLLRAPIHLALPLVDRVAID